MGRAVALRDDYRGDDLRILARECDDGDQTRRLLALATIYDGGSRTAAAKLGGVTLQIIRDWVMRFNAEGPDGLIPRLTCVNLPLTSPHPLPAPDIFKPVGGWEGVRGGER